MTPSPERFKEWKAHRLRRGRSRRRPTASPSRRRSSALKGKDARGRPACLIQRRRRDQGQAELLRRRRPRAPTSTWRPSGRRPDPGQARRPQEGGRRSGSACRQANKAGRRQGHRQEVAGTVIGRGTRLARLARPSDGPRHFLRLAAANEAGLAAQLDGRLVAARTILERGVGVEGAGQLQLRAGAGQHLHRPIEHLAGTAQIGFSGGPGADGRGCHPQRGAGERRSPCPLGDLERRSGIVTGAGRLAQRQLRLGDPARGLR